MVTRTVLVGTLTDRRRSGCRLAGWRFQRHLGMSHGVKMWRRAGIGRKGSSDCVTQALCVYSIKLLPTQNINITTFQLCGYNKIGTYTTHSGLLSVLSPRRTWTLQGQEEDSRLHRRENMRLRGRGTGHACDNRLRDVGSAEDEVLPQGQGEGSGMIPSPPGVPEFIGWHSSTRIQPDFFVSSRAILRSVIAGIKWEPIDGDGNQSRWWKKKELVSLWLINTWCFYQCKTLFWRLEIIRISLWVNVQFSKRHNSDKTLSEGNTIWVSSCWEMPTNDVSQGSHPIFREFCFPLPGSPQHLLQSWEPSLAYDHRFYFPEKFKKKNLHLFGMNRGVPSPLQAPVFT